MLALWLPASIVQALMIPLLFTLCAASGWAMFSRSGVGRSVDAIERWTVYALAGFAAVSVLGTLWAFVGLFKLWTVFPSLALVIWISRRLIPMADRAHQPQVPSTPVAVQVVVAIVLVVAAWAYAKPAESVLLTDDSAVYTIGGIVLARDGTLYYRPDELSAFEPADETGKRFALHHLYQFSYPESYAPVVSRHPGPFYRYPLGPSARIEIGFLALPKVWSALCVWAGSASTGTYAVPFLAVFGLALFYVYVRRAFGWPSGIAGMLVLGTSFSQFWFARFPLSEMHTQVVVLGSLVSATMARNPNETSHARVFAALTGVTLGLVGCLRFESPLLMAVLLPLVSLDLNKCQAQSALLRILLASALATWLLCVAGSVMTAPLYMLTRSINLISPTVIRLLALCLAAFVALIALARWRLGNLRSLYDRALSLAPLVITRCVGASIAIWLLHTLAVVVGLDARETVVGWLIAYWGALPFALTALSAAVYACTCLTKRTRPVLFGLTGLSTSLLLLYGVYPMVTIAHPWAIRRTVAYIGPSLACAIAAVPFWLSDIVGRTKCGRPWMRHVLRGIAWVAVAISLVLVAKRSAPFIDHREREGSLAAIQNVAQALPENAILLLEDGLRARQYGPYLELVLGHPTYPLRTSDAHAVDPPVVASLIQSAQAEGKAVCFLHDDGEAAWTLKDWQLTGREGIPATIRTVGDSTSVPPTDQDILTYDIILDLYDVTSAKTSAVWDADARITVPSGPGSYPYLSDGFNKIEMREGEPFRWTSSEARIAVPWPGEDPVVSNVCIALDIYPWRPAGLDPAEIGVRIEDKLVFWGTAEPSSGRQTLVVSGHEVIHDGDDDLDIVIETSPWISAAEASYSSNARELGLMFFGAEISFDSPCLLTCDGAYDQEFDLDGDAFRWTSGHTTLAYAWPAKYDEALDTIVMDLGVYQPTHTRPVTLSIDVEGHTVHSTSVTTDAEVQRFQLNLPTAGIANKGPETLDIVIESSTWSPATAGVGTDTRELGVMFYDLDHVE